MDYTKLTKEELIKEVETLAVKVDSQKHLATAIDAKNQEIVAIKQKHAAEIEANVAKGKEELASKLKAKEVEVEGIKNRSKVLNALTWQFLKKPSIFSKDTMGCFEFFKALQTMELSLLSFLNSFYNRYCQNRNSEVTNHGSYRLKG